MKRAFSLFSRASLFPALFALLLSAGHFPSATAAPAENLIIQDNDFLGPGGSDQQSILPLLFNPAVKVLGFTVVTGDGWENAESAHLRRFLEILGKQDIPVADGAVYPLVNTLPLLRLREKRFGVIPWKGAWGGTGSAENASPFQPARFAMQEGQPKKQAEKEAAALFLIRQVHAHPHKVTLVATGPLTNLALAIRLDPSFAQTAKALVFMGGLLDTSMESLTGSANFASDFNMIFDPEAAHIVLTAPWKSITAVGSVSNNLRMTKAYLKEIQQKKTPLTDYIATYYDPLPLWDEMATAIAADPSLITQNVEAYMDIDLSKGAHYGHALVWPESTAPKETGVRKVNIVRAIDEKRFLDIFRKAAQSPVPAPK